MEALKEVPMVAGSAYSLANVGPAEKPLCERGRKQELIAWIGIAAIGLVSAIAIYVLWMRTIRGL